MEPVHPAARPFASHSNTSIVDVRSTSYPPATPHPLIDTNLQARLACIQAGLGNNNYVDRYDVLIKAKSTNNTEWLFYCS